MTELLELEKQRKIIHLISRNPGVHTSKIAELLNMRIADIEIYLKNLESKGKIFIEDKGGFKRYYIRHSNIKSQEKRTKDMREEIHEIVAKTPGIHLSKIAEILEISAQLADYHLLNMEKNNEVIAIKDKGSYYKRYYIEEIEIGSDDKKIIAILRDEIPLKIILLLLDSHSLKHKEIYQILKISPSKLSYHLTKLMNKGIIDVISHGKEKGYLLKNKKGIARILKKYEKHLGRHIAIENFNNLWKDMNLF